MTNLVIRRERKQARYFAEKLGDSIALDMILIPGNTFIMGSPETETDRGDDEAQYEVIVSTFFMGRYPITQAQWRFVAELPQVKQVLNPNPSRFTGDDRPVEQVSWYDAVEFCDRLSIYTKRDYRLPSEAEWEYACRAGTTTPFYFGKTLTTELANYDGNYTYDSNYTYNGDNTYSGGFNWDYRAETTPVDQFGIANAFGLCDMHGNVYEWCEDHGHGSYEGAPTDGSAWLSQEENAARVIRGGSWILNPRICRSASRDFNSPILADYAVGFRVVCHAPMTL